MKQPAAEHHFIAPAAATPSTQPTTNMIPFARARGVISINAIATTMSASRAGIDSRELGPRRVEILLRVGDRG